MRASVICEVLLDLKLDQVLLESELEILEEMGEKSVAVAQQQWTRWRYKNVPQDAARGTSLRGWRYSLAENIDGQFVRGVEVVNKAKTKRGKNYARWVHRANTPGIKKYSDDGREWVVVERRIRVEVVPKMVKKLKEQIIQNVGRHRTKREFRLDRESSEQNFDILSQTTITTTS
tara:strand:+ start:279 stop:803 length:525 start_codon:yes stop_codon:yes gene_type:complete